MTAYWKAMEERLERAVDDQLAEEYAEAYGWLTPEERLLAALSGPHSIGRATGERSRTSRST
jgi:hypothetical protein